MRAWVLFSLLVYLMMLEVKKSNESKYLVTDNGVENMICLIGCFRIAEKNGLLHFYVYFMRNVSDRKIKLRCIS